MRERNNGLMPELPEVECVRRSLEKGIVGGRVLQAELLRCDMCESVDARGCVLDTKSEHLLRGGDLERVVRHGKQLAMVASDGRAVCIHLGMTGQVLVNPAAQPRSEGHVHARWTVRLPKDGRIVQVVFRDPRRFGGLWTFENYEHLRRTRWSALGPDALTISVDALTQGLSGRVCAVKAALLDQRTLAGVGNIYADEALFRAGLDPRTRAGKLDDAQVRRLTQAIRETLKQAIESGGSTLRDYRDATGSPGAYQERHAVYGRAGKACTRCGGTLLGLILAQRSTVYCPTCQSKDAVHRAKNGPRAAGLSTF